MVSQNLIHYDFTDYLIDWEDRELQPTFLCSLTVRGTRLLKALLDIAGEEKGVFRSKAIGLMDEYLHNLQSNLDHLNVIRNRIESSLSDST